MTTQEVTPAGQDVDRRAGWYRQMLEIRLFEDKVQELFMQGKIQGTTHLCQGQEAVSVGAVSALADRDYMTITYRGHGHALARGMSMVAAFGELMGRTSGCCSSARSRAISGTWRRIRMRFSPRRSRRSKPTATAARRAR